MSKEENKKSLDENIGEWIEEEAIENQEKIEEEEKGNKTKRYEALISFSGAINMHKGEVRSLINEALINDLLTAGYIKRLK